MENTEKATLIDQGGLFCVLVSRTIQYTLSFAV